MTGKRILWLALGGGTATGLLLLTRRAKAATPSAPAPTPTAEPMVYGETTRVPLAVPSGWRRATSVEVVALPELSARANELRSSPGFTSLPYGSLYPFTASDGRAYALWVEQHYHEPGGSVKPWGYHHGVTILARIG